MKTNWSMVMRSQGAPRVSLVRVVKATGWGGGYKRKPPSGVHKCLKRSEMAALLARMK
jgi:hypothetical protein